MTISFFMYTSLRVVSDPLLGLRNLRLLGMGARLRPESTMYATSTSPSARLFDDTPTPPSTTSLYNDEQSSNNKLDMVTLQFLSC